MLEKAGHRIVVAANGQLAVDALSIEHFDVVLMDVQMPVMDGFEAVAEIRRREEAANRGDPGYGRWHSRTPIIAMTAHAMAGDRNGRLRRQTDSIGRTHGSDRPFPRERCGTTHQLVAVSKLQSAQ
jgi:CheY-like chemotaxis protein